MADQLGLRWRAADILVLCGGVLSGRGLHAQWGFAPSLLGGSCIRALLRACGHQPVTTATPATPSQVCGNLPQELATSCTDFVNTYGEAVHSGRAAGLLA